MYKTSITSESLAQMIDQTLLKPNALFDDFERLCKESAVYGFKIVAINPAGIDACVRMLSGTEVLVGAAIGFPLGQNTLETKVFETNDAINRGAREIDYVINISEMKNGNFDYIAKEMDALVSICRARNAVSKVIFENCYLNDDEKLKLCDIALKCGPDFIKTSTGYGPTSATAQDVRLMKSAVGSAIKVKASGGIRKLDTVFDMLDAGAERIGTSAGVNIMKEFIALTNKAV